METRDDSLTAYLRETGDNLSKLALKIGRAPSTLTRALSGERNPSLGLALDVERGTDGRVKAGDFIAICMAARAGVEHAA